MGITPDRRFRQQFDQLAWLIAIAALGVGAIASPGTPPDAARTTAPIAGTVLTPDWKPVKGATVTWIVGRSYEDAPERQ